MIIGITVSDQRPYPKVLDTIAGSNKIVLIRPGELCEKIEACTVLYLWNLAYIELKNYIATNKPLPKYIYVSQQGVDSELNTLLEKRNVNLAYAKNVFSEAIAEYVLSSILLLGKGLHKLATQRSWNKHTQLSFEDINVLILGRGDISSRICEVLDLLGIKNVQMSSSEIINLSKNNENDKKSNVSESFNTIVSCLPLNMKTVEILNIDFFKHFKDANFINISRGGVLNEKHLVTALDNRNLSSALLDAFPTEPLPITSTLWADDRIVISPHQSYRTNGWELRLHSAFIKYIQSVNAK